MKKGVKNDMRRIILSFAAILLFSLLVSAFFTPLYADNDDYRFWSSEDERWSEFSYNGNSMSEYGDFVTSLTKLLIKAGQKDPSVFTPADCLKELSDCEVIKNGRISFGFLPDFYFKDFANGLGSLSVIDCRDSEITDSALMKINYYLNSDCYVIVKAIDSDNKIRYLCVDSGFDNSVLCFDDGKMSSLGRDYIYISRFFIIRPREDVSFEQYVADDYIRYRNGPGLSYDSLGSYKPGTVITVYEVTEADGYVWGKTSDGKWSAVSLCKYLSGTLSVLNYNVGEGGNCPLSVNKPSAAYVILSDIVPTPPEGALSFAGWSVSSDGNISELFSPLEEVLLPCDATLYAVWNYPHTHDFTSTVVEPTAEKQGYTIHSCECGEYYIDGYTDSIGYVVPGKTLVTVKKIFNGFPDMITVFIDGVLLNDDDFRTEFQEINSGVSVSVVLDKLNLKKGSSHVLRLNDCEYSFVSEYDTEFERLERVEYYSTPDYLRVRTAPSLSSETVEYLRAGNVIAVYETVYADGYTWGKTANGNWIAISICTYKSGGLRFVRYESDCSSYILPLVSTINNVVTETIPECSDPDCSFAGWSTKPDGEVEYLSGGALDFNDVTLYPVWEFEHHHNYSDEVVPPQKMTLGYTVHRCSCGHSYIDEYIDSLGKTSVIDERLRAEILMVSDPGVLQNIKLNGISLDGSTFSYTVVEQDGYYHLTALIFGVGIESGSSINVEFDFENVTKIISDIADGTLIQYDLTSVSIYKKTCYVNLKTPLLLTEGETFTGISDGEKSFVFTVNSVSGQNYILSCGTFEDGISEIRFPDLKFTVPVSSGYGNVNFLKCKEGTAISAFYQTRTNAVNSSRRDLRFIIIADLAELSKYSNVKMTITFYKSGKRINGVSGTLGGSDSYYKLFGAVSASGDIYVADEGCAIFGQIVSGVPSGAFDNFNILVKDESTGTVLLDVSLR